MVQEYSPWRPAVISAVFIIYILNIDTPAADQVASPPDPGSHPRVTVPPARAKQPDQPQNPSVF
jgi:hypothetical protein